MSTKPIFGYWNIRGLGQPIRYLLAYLGIDYEEKTYTAANEAAWYEQDKLSLGFDFPNLPYYIDGEYKLTQSLAILRYLGLKNKLDGRTEEERLSISLVEQQVKDLNDTIVEVSYDPNSEKLKPEFLENLLDQLKQLANYLGDRPFVAGTEITYVDFWLYEYLKKISIFVPDTFRQFPNFVKFIARIEALPRLQAYIKAQQPSAFNWHTALWNAQA